MVNLFKTARNIKIRKILPITSTKCVCALFFFLLINTVYIGVCIGDGTPPMKKRLNPNERFNLSASEVTELTKRANDGDHNSAFRLYEFYRFITKHDAKSFYWLEKAANGGHEIAQYNIAYKYIYDNKYKDHQKAMYWLEKGIKGGNSHSKELLDEYTRMLKDK